jgi:surfeit locus 1 family protein
MSEPLSPLQQHRDVRWGDLVFVLLMVALTGLFATLGMWQLQRLEEKEALIATVANRMDDVPIALPDLAAWDSVDWEQFNYLPLTLGGTFQHDDTVLVFTSLSSANGPYSGPGYWAMTPLQLTEGGAVFVNRGFVPQQAGPAFATGGAGPLGPVSLTGVGRLTEEASAFTPDADIAKRIEWVRDVDRLALLADPELAPFAPLYVDLPAGEAGALPQGGETRVEFSNNHLGYAYTWFGFALITPALLLVWLLARRRSRRAP